MRETIPGLALDRGRAVADALQTAQIAVTAAGETGSTA
jgi:hypothetical protein